MVIVNELQFIVTLFINIQFFTNIPTRLCFNPNNTNVNLKLLKLYKKYYSWKNNQQYAHILLLLKIVSATII